MADADIEAAVAAGVMEAESQQRALLSSIVAVARAIFRARAASVFLYEEASDALVFEAVSGEGDQSIVGMRISSRTGIAGAVLATREPIAIDDTAQDPRFSRSAAESTGYVPTSLLCAPLLDGDTALGVINVLDRPLRPGTALEDIGLLGQFANQAAIALAQLLRVRRVRRVIEGADPDLRAVARLARALDIASPSATRDGVALLDALTQILEKPR